MTPAEHAKNCRLTLRAAERALRQHHYALAAFAAEHGPALAIGSDIVTAAAAPKDPPPNPDDD